MLAPHTHIANLAVLEKLQQTNFCQESWFNSIFAQFTGTIDVSKDSNGNKQYKIPANPIIIMDALKQEGRDDILVPFLKRLKGNPVIGDTVEKGTGEEQIMWWLRCFVNQTRNAVTAKSGAMSEQRLKIYRLKEKARGQLQDWWGQWYNQDVARTFYEGASYALIKSTADDGLGLYKRYHPNYYVNDGGVLTKVAGTEGQTPTAAEIDTAVAAADTAMTADILKQVAVKCMTLRIPQMVTKDGHKFWSILMHPTQYRKLSGDSDFKAAQREAFSTKMLNSPELSGTVAYYYQFAIYIDIVAIRAWDNAAGGFFEDDDADPMAKIMDPTAITDNLNAIIFGNHAIGYARATKLALTEEIDDHGNIEEIGSNSLYGFGRADFAAEADAGEASGDLFRTGTTGGVASGLVAKNQSSLILMTKGS